MPVLCTALSLATTLIWLLRSYNSEKQGRSLERAGSDPVCLRSRISDFLSNLEKEKQT